MFQTFLTLFYNYVICVPKTTTTNKTSRYVAAETLCQLFLLQQPVKPILSKIIHRCSLPDRERPLAMNLVFGVLRKRQELDILLQKLSSVPLKKLQPFVHQTLSVGLYQLFYLENIPESAAVNEAVNSCKAGRIPKRLHGFVNAILRNAIRERENLLDLLQKRSAATTIHNHPDWLITRWHRQFGVGETTRICTLNNQEPTLTLRTNSLKTSRVEFLNTLREHSISAQEGLSPEAIILPDYHGSIPDIPGYASGSFLIQDTAAQLASLLLTPIKENGVYLDACAGLGGKTSHLLQLCAAQQAGVIAVEPDAERSKKFYENIRRLFPTVDVVLHSLTLENFAQQNAISFDGILVDAPCSGTGVIRRHPDIRWNRKEEDLLTNQASQIGILRKAAKMLAQGGVLVYATCSLEDEENDDVVEMFLQEFPEFSLTDCREVLPEETHHYVRNIRHPHRLGTVFAPRPDETIDGFFAARLKRQ